MEREEILKQVTEIFRDVFEDDEIVISNKTSAIDIPEWDSLIQIELIGANESHFGLRFGMKEILKMENVGDMINFIYEKKNQ
tara:strand:+ start:63 stop:308 length:246 start_codon:yes stop_codon:yes gene_type:complete